MCVSGLCQWAGWTFSFLGFWSTCTNKAECITSPGRGVERTRTWLNSAGSRGKGRRERGGWLPDAWPEATTRPCTEAPTRPPPQAPPHPHCSLAYTRADWLRREPISAWLPRPLRASLCTTLGQGSPAPPPPTTHPGGDPAGPAPPKRPEVGGGGLVFLGWSLPPCRFPNPGPKGAWRRAREPSSKQIGGMQEADVTRETGKCQSLESLRQTKRPHSEGTGGRERWEVLVEVGILEITTRKLSERKKNRKWLIF